MKPALRHSAAHVFVESLDAPELLPDDLHHVQRVLRVRSTDPITVADGRGTWASAVVDVDGTVRLTDSVEVEPEPRRVVIASAVPKGDRPEWMVQKLTEIGVTTIAFVACARSVVSWEGDRATRQMERLRRVAREAAMQSRRVWLPDLLDIVPLAELTGSSTGTQGVALAEPGGEPLAEGVHTVVIGPEGGFTPEELACGAALVQLSDQVLRVETAALVAAVRLLDGA